METPDISSTAHQFKVAAASYFGVPIDQLVTSKQDGSFVLVLRIALTPQDVTSIAVRMAELAGGAEQFQPDGLPGAWQSWGTSGDQPPTDRPVVMASEGAGGRKVQHVDVPEQQDAVSELPAAVWVWADDIDMSQYSLASDTQGEGATRRYLLQVALLTSEQKLKYGVGS